MYDNIAPDEVIKIWDLAEKLSLQAFEKKIGEEIYDDHVPLWEHAQIPTIDIIDFTMRLVLFFVDLLKIFESV